MQRSMDLHRYLSATKIDVAPLTLLPHFIGERKRANLVVRTGGFSVYIYIYTSDGLCTYRNTRLLILRTLVQFYILPHTPRVFRPSSCACVRMLSHATADSAWLFKQLENGSSRHRAFEADRGKHAYLHSGLQAGLQGFK